MVQKQKLLEKTTNQKKKRDKQAELAKRETNRVHG